MSWLSFRRSSTGTGHLLVPLQAAPARTPDDLTAEGVRVRQWQRRRRTAAAQREGGREREREQEGEGERQRPRHTHRERRRETQRDTQRERAHTCVRVDEPRPRTPHRSERSGSVHTAATRATARPSAPERAARGLTGGVRWRHADRGAPRSLRRRGRCQQQHQCGSGATHEPRRRARWLPPGRRRRPGPRSEACRTHGA